MALVNQKLISWRQLGYEGAEVLILTVKKYRALSLIYKA
jgi:hypothetical protein